MSEEPKLYDEEKTIPDLWSWIILILFSAAIAGYGIFTYVSVKDAPRRWDYGTLPDVPAQSVFNTRGPKRPAEAPRQIPLPPQEAAR
ncbi:MAG TPA: hypothetical protein VNX25_10095 [Verrucomicrobiae bacterium]|nr:hypothetical protein [Verrucomicrobiae bacterium]